MSGRDNTQSPTRRFSIFARPSGVLTRVLAVKDAMPQCAAAACTANCQLDARPGANLA
jgi:hypothetical protein